MGDSQTDIDRKLIRKVERMLLPKCDLVFASSDRVADEYVKVYGIRRPLPLYNVPDIEHVLPKKEQDEFRLYWRNTVIDLGQRGLDDALVALKRLPSDIVLHIQGRLPSGRRTRVAQRINELGIVDRVVIHPPFRAGAAVLAAAEHTVGLCLEREGIRNQELTVSNKIFDYVMAGLVVVASDLPGLRDVVERSGGGLLYHSGDSDDLAEKILALYNDETLRRRLAKNGRKFALSVGNRDFEMKALTRAFAELGDCQSDTLFDGGVDPSETNQCLVK
jgi:glycosyltransferase involved in cell wall biosynthesis